MSYTFAKCDCLKSFGNLITEENAERPVGHTQIKFLRMLQMNMTETAFRNNTQYDERGNLKNDSACDKELVESLNLYR